LTPAYRPTRAGVHRFPADALPWQATPEPGLRLKVVRYDDERGGFLGQVGFAPMARSGLHQHRGVATSFVIDGGLTDYQGAIGLHEAGINLAGATHDAVAYQNTVLVSRLEEPVVYPRERELLTGLHAGSRHDHIVNPAPEVPPDLNVRVDALPRLQTGVEGVQRQTIFDYAGTGSAHRFVQLHFAPGSRVPAWRAEAAVELWVRGGALAIGGEAAHGNTFVVIEPGASVGIEAPHGALALAWAEAPEAWLEGAADPGPRAVRRSLFGF
jgi:quercetin dioxygenase-like cupin family protein